MEAVSTEVSVRLASVSEKPLIEGLSQFYIYDFSEMEPANSANLEFNNQGGFGPLPDINDYWNKEGFYPLLICLKNKPVGFALLNTNSHRGGTIERNMGEFFVARKHRRRGFATEAIGQILLLYPGCWEVAVAERNSAAKAFWPRAISSAPNVSELIRLEGDGEHWRGPIWSFLAAKVQ
jgi:predicted acetyltransferase